MITSEKRIIKEIDVNKYTFNLKSQSTGKYSVQDSYRDNLKNGFLIEVNAPEDVKNALKDIYYATEKGLVISYKDFNGKIASIRKKLLAESFPNKDIKELSTEDRNRIELSSAKQVLKDLSINETTKLIYSPEISKGIEENSNEVFLIRFIPEELKIIFEEAENAEKQKIVKAYLEFSEKIKKIYDKTLTLYNLDDIELAIIEVNKLYESLEDQYKENNDTKNFYNQKIQDLKNISDKIKEEQDNYQNKLNESIKSLINNKDYKNIKALIYQIDNEFMYSELRNDTKSNSIKEFAINQLKNTGKVVALNSIEFWNDNNFSVAEKLLEEPLDTSLLEILKKKYESQDFLKRQEKEKLDSVNINDSLSIYEKFNQLTNQKDLFKTLFEKLVSENTLNKVLENSDNIEDFIILLSNNLDIKNTELLYKSLSENVKDKILTTNFKYQKFKNSKIKDIYFLFNAENAVNDVLEAMFSKMESKEIKSMNEFVLAKVADRISKFTYNPDDILKKTSINKLFLMLDLDFVKNNEFLNKAVIRVLNKWIPRLKANSNELNRLLKEFPEYSIYEITKTQLRDTDDTLILDLSEQIENNKELLAELIKKLGQKKIDSIIQTKINTQLKEDPNNFDNQYNSGITLLNNKDYDEAIKAFKKAVSINPESHLAHFFLGYCYELKNQNDIAISYYKKATQLKYNYIDAYYNLGMLYTKMKDYFLAIQQFKKILKAEPSNYNACIGLGIAYDESGDLQQALEYYDKAIKINPEIADAYINKAIVLTIQGKPDDAIDNYNLASERSHNNSKIQYNLGVIYHQKHDYSGAIAHYKLAIKFDKNNSMAYNNLGLAYFSKTRVEDAIEIWEKAILIDDKNIDAYNNLAWGYNVIGNLEKAIEIYQKAKTIDSKHSVLYMNLATVYYKNNQINEAIKELEMFLEIEPNSDKAFEVIKILKSLRNQLKLST